MESEKVCTYCIVSTYIVNNSEQNKIIKGNSILMPCMCVCVCEAQQNDKKSQETVCVCENEMDISFH